MYINRNIQQEYISKKESTSPTAAIEAILITGVIKVRKYRDMIMLDIPNIFIQIDILKDKDRKYTIIIFQSIIVNILYKIDLEVYSKYVILNSRDNKLLYLSMLKLLYGILRVSILYYK